MDYIDSKKQFNMIESIKRELKEKQFSLCALEINSIEYDKLFDQIIELKKKLDILLGMNVNNFNKTYSKLADIENKYGFLVDLTYEQQKQLILIVKEFKDRGYFDFINNLEFSQELHDIELSMLNDGIKITGINSLRDLDIIYNYVSDKYDAFEEKVKKFKEKISLLDFNKYNNLLVCVKENQLLDKKTLIYFAKFSQDNLVSQILSHYDEISSINKHLFLIPSTEHKIEVLKNRILKKQAILLENVKSYIMFNCISFSEISFDYQMNNNVDIVKLSDNIFELINVKRNNYKKLFNQIKSKRLLIEKFDESFKLAVEKVSPAIYEKFDNMDLSIIDDDIIRKINAEVGLYRDFNQPDQLLGSDSLKSLNKNKEG